MNIKSVNYSNIIFGLNETAVDHDNDSINGYNRFKGVGSDEANNGNITNTDNDSEAERVGDVTKTDSNDDIFDFELK